MESAAEIAREEWVVARRRQRAARDGRRVAWIDQTTLELRRARHLLARLPGEQDVVGDQIDEIIAELAQLRARIRTNATYP